MPPSSSSRRTTLYCVLLLLCLGLAHRAGVFLAYAGDLDALLALYPQSLTYHYPTPEGIEQAFGKSILYLQQTPPLPTLIVGTAVKLFGWPHGSTYFCVLLSGLFTTLSAMLMFRLLRLFGIGARLSCLLSAVFLLGLDPVLMEFNGFGQLLYEQLCMALLLLTALTFVRWQATGSTRLAVALGALCSGLALSRATFSFLFIVVAAFMLVSGVTRMRAHLGLFLMAVLILHGGWSLKNYFIYGTLRLSTSSWSGANLVHGLEGVGMDGEYAQHILRQRERYPEWFGHLIERDGASFYAKIRTSAQELLPREILDRDTAIQAELHNTNRPVNSIAFRHIADQHSRAYLSFALTHPGMIMKKVLLSYAVFWEPIRNDAHKYVGLLFVQPVIENSFALHSLPGIWLGGRLPEDQFVRTSRSPGLTTGQHRPTRIWALDLLLHPVLTLNLLVMHLLVPFMVAWILVQWKKNRQMRVEDSTYLLLVAMCFYMAFLVSLVEHIENMRYRLVVEPLIWILSATTLLRATGFLRRRLGR